MIRFTLVFIGICIFAMILIGWYDVNHHNPDHVSAYGKEYAILQRDFGETESYTVFDEKGDTVCAFYGSTDLFGSGAELYWWDIDNDGENELYCESSSRNQYLKFYPEKPPAYVELADGEKPPGVQTWLFNEMRSDWVFNGDFMNEQAILALGIIAGMLTLIITLIVRRVKRKKLKTI
jgi:hypothetical protein